MAAITASCSLGITGILTAGAPSAGAFAVGMAFQATGIAEPATPAPRITAFLTGSGLAGTYQTNLNQIIALETFTFILWEVPPPPPEPAPQFTVAAGVPVPVITSFPFQPPPPLPETVFGTTAVTSYSS